MASENRVAVLSKQELTTEILERVFQRHFQSSKVKLVDKGNLDALAGINDNLNSDIKRLRLIFEVDGDQREINAVIKVPLSDNFHAWVSKHMQMFKREAFWYTRGQPELAAIFPVLKTFTADCYLACSNYDEALLRPKGFCQKHCCLLCWCPCQPKEKGLIMLENVSFRENDKFKVPYKGDILSLKQVETALKALAHFHGAWYSFLNKKGDVDKLSFTPSELSSSFSSSLPVAFIKGPFMKTMKTMRVLLRNRGASEELINRFYSARVPLFNGLKHYACKLHDDGARLKTLIHADFWINNMMFNENDSKIIMLDFQNLRIGSPYYDIGYFLYIGTDANFRREHLEHILRVYFDVLKTYVGNEGFNDGKGAFEFDDFKREFEERRSLYFFGGIALVPNMLSPNPFQLRSMSDVRKLEEKRHNEIAGEDREDDHPLIKEIRRRLELMAYELDELKLI